VTLINNSARPSRYAFPGISWKFLEVWKMAFESIAEHIPEIESRLAKRQSPLRIAKELGLSKSIVYQYKKERFDIQGAALEDWAEEAKKSHEQRIAEGKSRIVNSLELLNKAKLRAEFLIDLEIGSPYTTADGDEKKLSLASAAIYWQTGQKMACEITRQEQELAGEDPESRKAQALESLSDQELDERINGLIREAQGS